MAFALALTVGANGDVFTGLFKIVSGSPATIDGCYKYCPLPSLSFLKSLRVPSFITNVDLFLYGDLSE